ncbi:piwi-like protein Ago3 [Homarus americanus]|nr:piwi-like protein Ago3 [Homarus americanus]
MNTDDSAPKSSLGRGGRGAALLRALHSLPQQPNQALAESVSPAPAVPTPCVSGGAGVQDDSSGTIYSSLGTNRGALISQLLKNKSALLPPGGDTYDKQGVRPKLDLARGRAAHLQTRLIDKPTAQVGAQSLSSVSQECRDYSSSVTEKLQQLSIQDTDDQVCRQGTTGTKLPFLSNWIRLSLKENKAVFEYEVKFVPQVDARNLRFRLLNSMRDKIGSVKSFDGSLLWLPIMLPNKNVTYTTANPLNKENVKIEIVYKKQTELDTSVHLYNVLFNRIMKILKLAKIGRNYFSPGGAVLIPQHQLEVWPGYVTAVNYQDGGLMLCVDVSHRVLRTQTCYDMMSELCQIQKANSKILIVKQFIGCIVLTRYNNKIYRIDDILFDQNPTSTFTNSEGEEITYVDYYYSAYGIKIKDHRQPLLLHRVKKKELKDKDTTKILCLIPELCFMTGLTDEMRSDFRVMKDIAMHTRITPTVRYGCLRTFIKNVNDNAEACKVLSDWGLTLEDNVIPLEGRLIPPEAIYFKNKEVEGTLTADWAQEAGRANTLVPVDLKPHCWLILFTQKIQQNASKFVGMLKQVTRIMGIHVGDPQMVCLPDDKTESYVNSLKIFYHDELQLAVIIFPSRREDRYSAVKRLACVDLALPTQCINSRTISQDSILRSVTQKIALQINCKLGGELWMLKIPMTGLMVCGIDVYNDPARRVASAVGFVSSINQTLTRWYSRISFQHPGEEVVHGLKTCLLEALRHYFKLYHVLPRTIIIYRDGVSDGQLKLVEDHEVPQLATVFHHFDSYEPKLAFIVVQKRINTRIFASMSSKRLDNPPPGCIIDHTISRCHWYDFLLVSQQIRQGTVCPTHYIVVHDGTKLKADNMQRLAYKLTYLYYNWPGTIRVPAPCQYAHKLAYLIGQNVRKSPAVELCDKLFFL